MASTPQFNLRPRNVSKSQKTSCGAIAPKVAISELGQKAVGKTPKFKKVAPKKESSDLDGVLNYTMDGERISPGNVRPFFLPFFYIYFYFYIRFYFILLTLIFILLHTQCLQWCSRCQNGGTVILCTACGVNSICTNCLELEDDDVERDHIDLECPACFLEKDKFGKYVCLNLLLFFFLYLSYIVITNNWFYSQPFLFRQVSSTRQHCPKILTTPLAIVSIHLAGMKDTPSVLTFHHLQPWLRGNLIHVELDFNFKNGVKGFQSRLDSMLDRFENGDLREYDCVCSLRSFHPNFF